MDANYRRYVVCQLGCLILLATAVTPHAKASGHNENDIVHSNITSEWCRIGQETPGNTSDIIEWVHDFFPDSATAAQAIPKMQEAAKKVVETSRDKAKRMGTEVIRPEAVAIARTLFMGVILAEIVFLGIRVMMRQPAAEQFTRLLVISFIFITVASGKPQELITDAMLGLESGGRWVGAQIISLAPEEVQTMLTKHDAMYDPGYYGPVTLTSGVYEPINYWVAWIGTPSIPQKGQTWDEMREDDGYAGYKFSVNNLMNRIWSRPDWRGITKAREGEGQAGDSGATDSALASASDVKNGMLMVAAPFQALGMAISVASVQSGAYATIMFTAITVLAGAQFAFHLTSSMGMALLPLMYFKKFESIWVNYLMALAALALVPCLYYIFAAMGFLFSTSMFEIMFPWPGSGSSTGTVGSFAVLLSSVFAYGIYSIMAMAAGFLISATDAMSNLLEKGIYIVLLFGRILYGSTIVAAFVFGGNMFASLAVTCAFKWSQGFATEEVLSKINEFFNGIQGAVGTGMGQMYSQGIAQGASFLGGIKNTLNPRTG